MNCQRPGGAHDGWFVKWDQRNPSGEPLVAVTSSAETLAAYCIDVPMRSKLVVVNGLARVRDLQAYDAMQQTQRLVLFADEDDEDLIRTLGDRGCRFWELSLDEIEAGQKDAPRFQGTAGRLRIWARNKECLALDAEACDNPKLEEVCLRLESLRQIVDDDHEPAMRLVARMWGFLNHAAARVKPMSDEDRTRGLSQLQEFHRDLRANSAWVAPEAERALAEAASVMESLLSGTEELGSAKATALERTIAQGLDAGATSIVLVRNERQRLDIGEFVRSDIDGERIQVCTPRDLKGDQVYDRMVCLSWPTGETLESVISRLIAPRITLLGYAFERRWLHQFKARRLSRVRRAQITSDQKSAIVNGRAFDELPSSPEPLPDAARSTALADDSIWAFEQRLRAIRKGAAAVPTDATETLPARYVSFVGTAFAFLTETHKVVVATLLVSAAGRIQQRLPEQTVGALAPGDFIVFPESGDRELIQEKADQLLGAEAHVLRSTARLWKEALWSSGLKPGQFLREARELGRPRHIMTIRNWFADTSQIGPGVSNEDLSEDLELIALVTDFEPLKQQQPRVIEAAKRLRSAHLSAGVRLRDVLIKRLPEMIGHIEEDGSVVDLGELGRARIVQIESVASTTEPRGRGEVNRLTWGDDTAEFDMAF